MLDVPICLDCAKPVALDAIVTAQTQPVPGLTEEDPWMREDPWHPSLRDNPKKYSTSYYPVFEWESDAEDDDDGPPPLAKDDAVCVRPTYHTTTRLPDGEEGLLVDCGAVDNLTGAEFVKRQTLMAAKFGYQTM